MTILKKNKTRKNKILKQTVYDACLMPLLKLLNWRGKLRHLKESLPHYSQLYSVNMLCKVIENLGFETESYSVQLKQIEAKVLPCIFVNENNEIFLLASKQNSQFEVFNSVSKKYQLLDLTKIIDKKKYSGTIYTFKRIDQKGKPIPKKIRWVRKTYLKNRPLVYSALGVSFFLSILALGVPLFIMLTYNRVIKAYSINMLGQFSIGIAIVLIGFLILSKIRAQQLSIVGARLNHFVGDNIFERLLYLSPNYTASASLGSQVARLKDFSRLRDFVTGQLMTTFFETPFITIALIIIAALGGLLVLIPITMVIIYALLGFFLYRETQRRIEDSSLQNAKLQEFALEAVNKLRAIKYAAATKTWQERYRDLSANTAYTNFKNTMLIGINNSISDVLTIATGIAVLGFSAIKIMNGTLSVGAMLAIMILSWRILAPLKMCFNTYTRLLQMGNSLRQISNLMKIEPEIKPTDLAKTKMANLRGDITFDQVSLRYPDTYQPALLGVSFHLKPGEWVGITGRNGSGKSSILKLLLRVCQQQVGNVQIDKQDIRQFNEIELRSSIAYLPQTPELFYGTIASNLRLANPAVRNTILIDAAKKTGILDKIIALPNGFDTHIRDFSANKLSTSFQQELCLVRALIKQAPILLLDEPAAALDKEADARLIQTLKSIHGKATILMVTHRPSHMKLMDHLLVLDNGMLIEDGPPDKILAKMPKGFL